MSPSPQSTTKPPTTPFYYHHVPKNILLILLSIITLPISSALVLLSLLYTKVNPPPRPIPLHDGDISKKTILITGVSMTKGLTIARILAQHTPHRIIGADTSSLSPGRFSRALSAYYNLTSPDGRDAEPYIDSLLDVIRRENVDLWISCSSVVAAVEDGEVVRLAEKVRGAGFKAVQFREDVVERLHEKDRFIEYIASLNLPIPESHRCTTSDAALSILLRPVELDGKRKAKGEEEGKEFILKPIGVDDKARANMMTLLPFTSASETTAYVKSLGISESNPFQLQQFIQGDEYCTHALIICGRVVAFTACPSSDLLMHYEALPPSSPLFQEMLAFTARVAEDGGENFSGHLSFDFLIPSSGSGSSIDRRDGQVKLYPIECNPRAHTAVALFSSTPQLASAYLSAFPHTPSSSLSSSSDIVTPRTPTPSYYWLGHDLVTLLILPALDFLWSKAPLDDVLDGWTAFREHVVGWRDGTFEARDPVPFWVLYHVYWPVRFLRCLGEGRRWSRVNVSTTKVFEE